MTLPNNFRQTPNKLRKFWNESESQRVDIEFQKQDQSFVVRELGRTVTVNAVNKKFVDLSTAWVNPTVTESTEFLDSPSQQAIKGWTVTLTGLLFEEAIALRSNFQMRFGSGGAFSDNLLDDTNFWTTDYIEVVNLADSRQNTFIFHFGILLSDNQGIEEIDQGGLQVRMNLTLMNPIMFM